MLERSYHVATLDWDKDEIEARTVEFLSGVLPPRGIRPAVAGPRRSGRTAEP